MQEPVFVLHLFTCHGCIMPCLAELLLTVICPHRSIFSFLDENLSKYQWIFTKVGMCIDFVDIWFWIVNEQIMSTFDSYLPTKR